MALTRELLTANECLSGLTEEQIATIVKASENNENEVIGKKVGEIHRQYDADIKESTGVDREGDEKTYNYLKRAFNVIQSRYADYDEKNTQVTNLTAENEKLKAEIAKGGDEAMREQSKALQKELASTKAQYTELVEKHKQSEEAHERQMKEYRIDSVLSGAEAKMQIKAGMNEAVLSALRKEARANVLSKHPAFEERNGHEVLIFHTDDGTPLTNEKNKLEPYTAEELLVKEYERLDLLEKKNHKGAGGKGNLPAGGSTAFTTKVEATATFEKQLAERGLAKGTSEYQEEFNKLWVENDVSSLPTE